jgi:hypothetical protein
MELRDLVGCRYLSGVDMGYHGDARVIRLKLDKIYEDGFGIYEFIEDHEDGYRSCCQEVNILSNNISINNTFNKIFVFITYIKSISEEVILIDHGTTRKTILKIGTVDTSSYYPVCCMEYHPENIT